MGKPAVYLRVSSDQQRERQSIKSQEEALKLWLKTQDMTPDDVLWYRDDGVSGVTPILERGDSAKLAKDIEAKLVTGWVALFSVSRISRDVSDFFNFRKLLKAHNVALLSISDSVDTRNETGDFVAGVHALVAEEGHKMTSRASRVGKLRTAKAGKWQGRLPYGYRFEDGNIAIDPAQSLHVRTMFQMYLEGQGTRKIADYLNDNNIRSSEGGIWRTSAVLALLHNSAYMGKGIWNRQEIKRGKRTGVIRPESEHIVIAFPVLVDPTEWHRVQQLLDYGNKRFQKKGEAAKTTLLTRTLCAVCGARYFRYWRNDSHKGYYRHAPYEKPCGSAAVYAEIADPIVWGDVLKAIDDPDLWLSEMQAKQQSGSLDQRLKQEAAELEALLAELERRLLNLEDMAESGALSIERFAKRADALNTQGVEARRRLLEIQKEIERRATSAATMTTLASTMRGYQSRAHNASHEQKQDIVNALIAVVYMAKVEDEITLDVQWAV